MLIFFRKMWRKKHYKKDTVTVVMIFLMLKIEKHYDCVISQPIMYDEKVKHILVVLYISQH